MANGLSTALAGLAGPFAFTTESTGWWDSITLNYNVEANLYNAATSNHVEALDAYFAPVASLLPLGRARARTLWQGGGHEPYGATAQRTQAMGCACVDYASCGRRRPYDSAPRGSVLPRGATSLVA